jgi:hypothetical protein
MKTENIVKENMNKINNFDSLINNLDSLIKNINCNYLYSYISL